LTNKSLEARVESFEKQLHLLQKSVSEKLEFRGRPAEIRTQDPRHVKASYDIDIWRNFTDYQEQETLQLIEAKEPQLFSDFWVQHSQSFNDWLSAKDISESTKRDYFNALTKFFVSTSIQKPHEFRGLRLKAFIFFIKCKTN